MAVKKKSWLGSLIDTGVNTVKQNKYVQWAEKKVKKVWNNITKPKKKTSAQKRKTEQKRKPNQKNVSPEEIAAWAWGKAKDGARWAENKINSIPGVKYWKNKMKVKVIDQKPLKVVQQTELASVPSPNSSAFVDNFWARNNAVMGPSANPDGWSEAYVYGVITKEVISTLRGRRSSLLSNFAKNPKIPKAPPKKPSNPKETLTSQGTGEIKNVYNSIKQAPKYPSEFKAVQNGTKKVNVKNQDVLEKLREVESGQWKKIYKDGYDSKGKKISIHYFESQSGKVFDVKVKSGWSNK
ncbi:hypothetical protein [Aneurinibacillus aneurinilyticus]|uniref:hypothetical protein n=1 Tax=Aneurinibacillus aneurinilyticus TaxID=1391 RepID=UPI0023F096AB|nr:hypothetical protein [Aneurinibacillus aneurinilyticus]